MSTSSSHPKGSAMRECCMGTLAALEEALQKEGIAATPDELLDQLTKAAEERSALLAVTVATPSGDCGPLKESISRALEKKTGRNVSIREVKDPSLIGGAVISYGDERIDLSVKRALEDAEMLLSQHQ